MVDASGSFMRDYLSLFTVKQLKGRLIQAGINCSGNKPELIQRLKTHMESEKVLNDVSTMKDIMEDYISNTEQYGDEKLVDKLLSRIESKLVSKGMSAKEYVQYLFNLAEKRIKSRATNIFLMNIGSSGSHWIEAMLDEFPEIHCINEVYFPKILRKKVKNLDGHALNLMMNVIHLAHLKTDEELQFDSIIVNSAHVLGTDFYRKCDNSCMCIMLARDPYDIVVSRTFRKNSYREYIAPAATDLEYLELNIFRVNRFYNRHLEENFNGIIKYEHFIKDGINSITDLLKTIGVKSIDNKLVREICYKHDRNTIISGKSKNAANLYTGERKKIPEDFSQKIIRELKEVRKGLNYI